MPSHFLAAGAELHPTEHAQATLFGLTFNIDTVIGTVVAAGIVVVLGLLVRWKVTSGVPSGMQLAFESITKMMRDQVQTIIGVRVAPFLIPLSLALFVFTLVGSWLTILPLHIGDKSIMPPPTADVNCVYPLALLVFGWKHVSGARQHGGAGKQLVHTLKGHMPAFAFMWVIEEISGVVSHALRLFGNIFAGVIMLELFALMPAYIEWAPNAAWKLFDMFIGLVQAFIFALLTIIYFGQAMEDREGEH
ncbi:MAG: FoF1 ATP synthase subunit A [Sciscionella sp.]